MAGKHEQANLLGKNCKTTLCAWPPLEETQGTLIASTKYFPAFTCRLPRPASVQQSSTIWGSAGRSQVCHFCTNQYAQQCCRMNLQEKDPIPLAFQNHALSTSLCVWPHPAQPLTTTIFRGSDQVHRYITQTALSIPGALTPQA